MEYKTTNDCCYFPEKCQQDIWDYYTPTDASPRPHRFHLLHELRTLGWAAVGLDAALRPGTSPLHDRMVPILLGHGAFIPHHTVHVVFQRILDLRKKQALVLARELVRHQALATDRIMTIVYQLRRSSATSTAQPKRPLTAPSVARSTGFRTGIG